jgi:hypothetical protein
MSKQYQKQKSKWLEQGRKKAISDCITGLDKWAFKNVITIDDKCPYCIRLQCQIVIYVKELKEILRKKLDTETKHKKNLQ